jgi:hypothetical protein
VADPNAPEAGEEATPDSLSTFETGTEPEEPSPDPEPAEDETDDRGRRTLIAIGLALAVSLGTVIAARSLLIDTGVEVGLGETASVGLIATIVGLAAFLPLRWGFWVAPLVAGAHYALNFYNMLFTDESVYQFVEGSAMGYAVLTPAIGVVLGFVLEGVYRLIVPSDG